jgi:hypothetical protein
MPRHKNSSQRTHLWIELAALALHAEARRLCVRPGKFLKQAHSRTCRKFLLQTGSTRRKNMTHAHNGLVPYDRRFIATFVDELSHRDWPHYPDGPWWRALFAPDRIAPCDSPLPAPPNTPALQQKRYLARRLP